MTPQRPDETTLHAWVDGELQPDAAAAVAQWLAEHPEEAARMAAIQAQNAGLQALHAQLLEEPVPPQLIRTLQRPTLQWRWQHALAAGIMLFSGVQLMSIGILGEYIGRIYEEVKRRPTYLVARDEDNSPWRDS